MTVEELLVFAKKHIHSDHAKILLAEILGKNSLELLMYLDDIVDDEKAEKYKKEVLALKEGKPVQYAIGNINFYGYNYDIDERVLIPRFETEELVENTIKLAKEHFKSPVDIIDLGTGSGVIGLTLEKELSTNSVDLVDISKEALEVTKINCEKHNSKANIIHNDMLNNITKKYDIIISNPPYISYDEEIEDIVKNNEPTIALYASNNGLHFYEEILNNIKNCTKDKYLVAFEIGYKQKNDILNLINKNLNNVKVFTKKDLQERDRMIFILKDE